MNDTNPAQLLPAIRIAIGGGAWTMPGLTGKLFGFRTLDNQESIYLGRLFGVRDIALAAGVLASSGESRKLWWRIGVACDLADAAAGALSLRNGGPKRAGVMSTLTALAAAGLGVAAIGSQEA